MRHASQRVFWIRRCCRLFPLYWASIGIAALLRWLDWLPDSPFYPAQSATTYLYNLTMVPNFFNRSSVLSVFWSMHIEALFYILVAVVGLFGLHKKTSLIGILILTITLLAGFVPGLGFGPYYPLFLAIIWCGAMLQRAREGHESHRRTASFIAATLMVVWLAEGQTSRGLYHVLGTLCAFAIAWAALYHPAWLSHRFLIWLGTISYSLYLTHLLVLAVIPPIGTPFRSRDAMDRVYATRSVER